jgi:hypothetical protein
MDQAQFGDGPGDPLSAARPPTALLADPDGLHLGFAWFPVYQLDPVPSITQPPSFHVGPARAAHLGRVRRASANCSRIRKDLALVELQREWGHQKAAVSGAVSLKNRSLSLIIAHGGCHEARF